MQRTTRPVWPGGASVAVVITVDHDAEYFWYRVDPSVRERAKTKSMGEYGARRGTARVLDALARYDAPSTWFVPGAVADVHRPSVEAVVAAGHEVAARGYELESFVTLDSDAQLEALESGMSALQAITGIRPTGFRGWDDIGSETPEILLEHGIAWTSQLRGDDRPSYLGGSFSAEHGLVDLPAAWELTDMPRFGFNYGPAYPRGQGRIAPYGRVLQDWIDEFEAYRRHGGLYLLTLDPQSIGKPGRILILDRLLAHIRATGDAWIATGGEVAAHWRATVPGNDIGESERIRRRTRAGRG